MTNNNNDNFFNYENDDSFSVLSKNIQSVDNKTEEYLNKIGILQNIRINHEKIIW